MSIHPSYDTTGLRILRSYNGRPTLFLEVQNSEPLLTWRAVGVADPFDIWVQIALTWDEADEFIEAGASVYMDDYLQTKVGRPVLLLLHGPTIPSLLNVSTFVPDNPGGGVAWMLATVMRLLEQELAKPVEHPVQRTEKLRRREIQGILAAV